MFAALGAEPLIGSLDASARTAVVSHGFWMRRFGGDRAALGRNLILDGEPFTLAGVLPPEFRFPRWKFMPEPDIYLPLSPNPDRGWHYIRTIGRLKPGVTLAQARADIALAHPAGNRNEGAKLALLSAELTRGTGATLEAFAGAVLLVLIVGCANVSNLLLGQAVRRRREIAIRQALGARRVRLLRQFLVETSVLAFSAAAGGVVLALCGMPLLVAALPVNSEFSAKVAMGRVGLNWSVLGFAAAIALVAALLSGILPAWRASRQDRGARFLAGRTARHQRLRGAIVAAEVALSLVLLAGAGLLVKSLVRLLAVDPGFDARHLLTIDLELPENKYPAPEQRAEFVRAALDRLARIPGVSSAAAVNGMPLTRSSVDNGFSLPGSPQPTGPAGLRVISPGYFETMGIPLLRGRLPARDDAVSALINEAMARRYWPDDDPLGKEIETVRIERVRTAQGRTMRMIPEHFRIIGIVGDVRQLSLEVDPFPEMFLPCSRMARSDITFVLRGRTDAAALARAARQEILAVDPDQPLAGVHTIEQLISQDVSERRFVLLLLAVFATLGVALSAAGIFAVVSHSVSERTREIGIRVALGAEPAAVIGIMVRQTFTWVVAGLAAGAAVSLAAGGLLHAWLYAVEPHDPAALALAAAAMAAIAALAAFVPARAAARVDPATTLRCE